MPTNKKPRVRLEPQDRREDVLTVALQLTAKHGLRRVTRQAIAEKAGVSGATVTHYLGVVEAMRKLLMREAVKRRIVPLVAQGLAERDPIALKAPEDLKAEAVAHLTRP